MYKVYTTQEFDKIFEKLDNSVKIQIGKGIEQIAQNPYLGNL